METGRVGRHNWFVGICFPCMWFGAASWIQITFSRHYLCWHRVASGAPDLLACWIMRDSTVEKKKAYIGLFCMYAVDT